MNLKRANWGAELTSGAGMLFSWIAAALVGGVCLFIVGYLWQQGHGTLNWSFLSTDPNGSIAAEQGGGIRIPLVGSLVLILGSLIIAVPLSIASCTYLAEYMDESNRLTRVVRIGLEVLASVPSVVFGMFGLALFTLPSLAFFSSTGSDASSAAFGRSFLVACIIMGVHVLPFMVKAGEEAIRSVPKSYRHGAAALGMTKWRTIRKVVLPAAAPGIATGIILGTGVVVGDTAIVNLLLGNTMTMAVDNWWSPDQLSAVLHGTGATLTTFIYFNSPAGDGNSPNLAFGAALVLVGIVILLNLAAMLIARRQANTGRV